VIGLNKGTLVGSGGETGKLGNWEMVLIGWLATLFFLIIRHVHHLFWLAQHQQLKRLWYELKVVFFFCFTGKRVKVSNSRPSGDSALDIKYSLSPILHE